MKTKIPRDGNGTFNPTAVPEYEKRLRWLNILHYGMMKSLLPDIFYYRLNKGRT